MPVEEQLATIFKVLEGGGEVPAGEIIQFPADVAGAGSALEGTTTTVELGNGIATEISQLTATEAGATTTAGVGLLALDVGVAGAAIAPALGILAGVGLYSLAPEFWTNVSNKLLEAGQTINGKVRAFINGNTKQMGLSKETINIFKDAFIAAGLYTGGAVQPNPENYNTGTIPYTNVSMNLSELINQFVKLTGITNYNELFSTALSNLYDPNYPLYQIIGFLDGSYASVTRININPQNVNIYQIINNYIAIDKVNGSSLRNNKYYEYRNGAVTGPFNRNNISYLFSPFNNSISNQLIITNALWDYEPNENLQPGATYPTTDPFPQTYPTWNPWSVPVEGFPDVYPIEVPAINPDPDQQQAQTPQEIPDNDPNALDWLIETLPQPDPNPNPYPEPAPNPDPDPVPEPEPIPEPEPEPTPDNPVDPNPEPTNPFLPVVPDMPDTVESNAMFTVYKPSMTQVNSFGGWLWSSNIVEQIKRIWQNPLDGIISFMKVYVDAPTSGSDTIKVGILDSGVSSPIVSGQFVTVECGSLNVREKFYNATDYSPFVAMHLYLPFIGIVELDIDEFMRGEIKVTYHVDVYTGTCLAEVKSRRSPDMPEWTIVYTFSGNASQQLPLTSAEFSGALSSLVGVVGGGLAVASGGGLGLLAGATGIAKSVTHEMVHLAHSGSLSANAGIMGARKPYLILTRRRSYDANGYNELYGYPSNKTVYLNNCSGYVKVKDIRLETVATDSERIEIESLLKAGVII